MKPSIILYKTLPDNLVNCLKNHFIIHNFDNISPKLSQLTDRFFPMLKEFSGRVVK